MRVGCSDLPYIRSEIEPNSSTKVRQTIRPFTVRDLLNGDLGAHRHLPVDPADEFESEEPAPAPVEVGRVYTRDDAQRAWARRRADLDDLAGIDHVLAEIDARAKELERRTAAMLAAEYTDEPDQRKPEPRVPRRSPDHRRPKPGPSTVPMPVALTLDHSRCGVPPSRAGS